MKSIAIVAALALTPVTAAGAKPPAYMVKSRASVFDAASLVPLLQRGEMALVEADGDRVLQTIMFGLIDAPAGRVYDILTDVEQYPEFIKTIAQTRVTKRRGGMFSYRWKLAVPLITLEGTRLQRGRRPSVIEVRGVKGNFRNARERWEFFPVAGGKKTVAAFYRTLDVETGGLIVETLAKLEPSFGQALSVSTGFVHMRSVQWRAAGVAPLLPRPQVGPVPPFLLVGDANSGFDMKKMKPLLKLGKVALIESHPDGGFKQVTIMTQVAAPKARLAQMLSKPDDYPKFIPNFARQTSTALPDKRLRLEWELEVPFVNLEGTSVMTIEPNGSIDILNDSGDIPRGRFRWEFLDAGSDASIPIHYAYSDIREASFFTRALIKKQPLFEHGAVIASAAVALSAVKAHAEGLR